MAFSPQEKAYYDQLFSIVDKDQAGVLPGQDALPFLVSSNLPQQTLGEVWALSDPENNGFLTREGWYRAARLIGWVQKGGKAQVDESLLSRAGPYPTFQGQPPPPPQAPASLSAQTTGQRLPPLSMQSTGGGLPPLTAADRTKFTRIFVGCGPQNGLVSGEKARDVFVKSQLGYEKLGLIWNLADTQQRGSLDLPDFIIGMFLIQTAMASPNLSLPATLPAGVYEQASGGRPPPNSPIARQNTGGGASPLRAQYTGGTLQPQRTGQSTTVQPGNTPPRPAGPSFASPPPSAFSAPLPSAFAPSRQMSAPQWDVTPEAKANSDRFFSQLDPQAKGVIEGDVAVPFMLQSQLDEGSLASIWDLADIRHEGRLDRDQFAVAMHLINEKLAGKDVPASLPNSLIPPSLRNEFGSGGQEVLATGQSSTTKDLFDRFDDPPAPAPVPPPAMASPKPFNTQAFLPQPPSRKPTAPVSRQMSPAPGPPGGFGAAPFAPASSRSPAPPNDLLGDDSAEPPRAVPDNSADIGNKQNQLTQTTRSLSEAEKTRADLEKSAADSAAQLSKLEESLSSARVKHEAETKAVADLRIRVGEQTAKITQLNADVISAESDLTAMKLEKDELGQALLRDKEEVRGLQKKMKELEDEKAGLKLMLEKLKKDARQQKGMVTIAKKQLSTAESGKDTVQQEIKEMEKAKEEQATVAASTAKEASPAAPAAPPGPFSPSTLTTAAGIALPATPRALSPNPTGASQRSNNPFDRLSRGAQTKSTASTSPGAPSMQSPPPSQESASPSIATTAATAVGMAAGVVAAGAATLYGAAKEAVGSEEEPVHEKGVQNEEHDPFGAAQPAHPKPTQKEELDPFGVSETDASPIQPQHQIEETDPFGMPTSSGPTQSAFDTDFDSGFGDSFAASKPREKSLAKSAAAPSDFDSAFADFDQEPQPEPAATEPVLEHSPANDQPFSNGIPSGIPKSAIPETTGIRPDVERTISNMAVAPGSRPDTPLSEAPVYEHVGSGLSQEVAPSGVAHSEDDAASSDEDEEGPEDLEEPTKDYKGKGREIEAQTQLPPAISQVPPSAIHPPPIASPTGSEFEGKEPKVRRSAPRPPAARTATPTSAHPISNDEFDPFGSGSFAPQSSKVSAPFVLGGLASSTPAPAPINTTTSLPPGAAPANPTPKTAAFEDDDFDFSDLPPAQVETEGMTAPPHAGGHTASAFDDEFAGFDDEFDKPSTGPNSEGSNGMSKSYEMVSPNQPSGGFAPTSGQTTSAHYDEWGFGAPGGHGQRQGPTQTQTQTPQQHAQPVPPSGGTGRFSFDDAFGGDFEPAPTSHAPPAPAPAPFQAKETFAPPPGPPPSKSAGPLSPPAVPTRRESGAQADDIEDVKKLCAMGFDRSLVIAALDANGYDFQKTLNVLLQ